MQRRERRLQKAYDHLFDGGPMAKDAERYGPRFNRIFRLRRGVERLFTPFLTTTMYSQVESHECHISMCIICALVCTCTVCVIRGHIGLDVLSALVKKFAIVVRWTLKPPPLALPIIGNRTDIVLRTLSDFTLAAERNS